MMRRTAGLIATVVLLVAAPAGAAGAETRVTNDGTPGSYTRYDGGSDATMQALQHRPPEPERAQRRRRPDATR